MPDWEKTIQRGFESKDLDYKGPSTWDEGDKKACCEMVKDILAIANTKGGFIVIGVSETPSGFVWDGLSEDQCKSFETSRVNRFLQNYTDPPINTHIIKEEIAGSTFVIIEIPKFSDTPHICQKDYPQVLQSGAIYVRTDNNESAPIRDSSDMRAIVEHAIRNRGDQLLTSFRAVLTGTPQLAPGPSDIEQFAAQIKQARARCNEVIPEEYADLGFRETVFHPARFEKLRFTFPELERMAEAASVTYRGWPYIFYSERRADCLSHLEDSLEMRLNDAEVFQFWRLHQSGCLYLNELFQEDERNKSRDQRVLGTTTFAYTCAEAIQCLVNLFAGVVADDELIRFHLRLEGVRGRTLAMVRANTYVQTPYQCDANQIVYEKQLTLADWRAGVISHAIELLASVEKKFHAPPPSLKEAAPLMQDLLGRQM